MRKKRTVSGRAVDGAGLRPLSLGHLAEESRGGSVSGTESAKRGGWALRPK